jgi:protein SCO1/2
MKTRVFLFSAAVLFAAEARAQVPAPAPRLPGQVPDVEVLPKLGNRVPLELVFRDESGAERPLADYFGKRPVVLALVYYECPMLCTMVLNGLVRGLKPLSIDPGREMEVVVVSIDPGEAPALAAQKKKAQLAMYGRPETAAGWHFLTGREEAIASLARAVGLGYVYQPEIDQYAHAAAITVLTEEGRVSRYLYGIDYAPRDIQLAVAEASELRVASVADRLLLLCFHYDPVAGKYGFAIMSGVRFAGVLTVVGLGLVIGAMVRRERRGRAAKPAEA